ncbi:exodeoxyribonuclease VII large subunit [Sphingobacteriales bacterium UPWRP_1]|nr:exodeoxyribonuclease VII large subunit [Sphingobacteriales bacterium TSM_CSM]PSJ73054.1 exodeoxyribonuclease VII large subunit [Sphingobacteriales bacterium UPWRP_1]
MKPYITLSQLNGLVREVISEAIKPDIWVIAEISQIKMAGSGHWFIDLVEKEREVITAKLSGVIWNSTYNELRMKFGADLVNLLKNGNKVLFSGTVGFHEVYGLKIVISDIDPSVTLGELELKRMETIQRLTAEGYIGKNAQLPLPMVLQRIAVISSASAAGFGDFMNHTQQNRYGYSVWVKLFPSLMQGEGVEQELIGRLREIEAQKHLFDAVVIIRGGGSKLDLDAFNNYHIAVAIAQCSLPVLTGIGHQQDETVADLVAHTSLKTPTAVAEYILQTFLHFESAMLSLFNKVSKLSVTLLKQHHFGLQTLRQSLAIQSRQEISRQKQQLNLLLQRLPRAAKRLLQTKQAQLQHTGQTIDLFNVEKLLKRGFTITRMNGKALKSAATAQHGQLISTQFADGTVNSRVEGKQ